MAEKSALEQAEGGPCAIIAPIQAFILKNLLLQYEGINFKDFVTDETQNQILVTALCEILQQCNQQRYYVVHLNREFNTCDSNLSVVNGDGGENSVVEDAQHCVVVDPVIFHQNLRILMLFNIKDVEKYYYDNIQTLRNQYGILLFLYSVIATRVRYTI